MRSEGDIVFYALGTGEYDELNCKSCVMLVTALVSLPIGEVECKQMKVGHVHAVAETIRAVSAGLRDTIRKPTEATLFDNYGRVCMVIDEVINEARTKMHVQN